MSRDELGFHWLVGPTTNKLRRSGKNIAPREVEMVIRELPEIAEVAAVPVRDVTRGEEVTIWIETEKVLRQAIWLWSVFSSMLVRTSLRKMPMPRYIVFAPALPTTKSSNGVLKREPIAVSDFLAGAYDTEDNAGAEADFLPGCERAYLPVDTQATQSDHHDRRSRSIALILVVIVSCAPHGQKKGRDW